MWSFYSLHQKIAKTDISLTIATIKISLDGIEFTINEIPSKLQTPYFSGRGLYLFFTYVSISVTGAQFDNCAVRRKEVIYGV